MRTTPSITIDELTCSLTHRFARQYYHPELRTGMAGADALNKKRRVERRRAENDQQSSSLSVELIFPPDALRASVVPVDDVEFSGGPPPDTMHYC